MTRRPTTTASGLTPLRSGKTSGLSAAAMDHDTTGLLATGEPTPPPGMRWRVLGLPSSGRRDERHWRFIGHAQDEASAIQLGRDAARSPEWTRWKREPIPPGLERASGTTVVNCEDVRRAKRLKPEVPVYGRDYVMALVRRVLGLLGRDEPADLQAMSLVQLEHMFNQLGGNAVLSSRRMWEAARRQKHRKQARGR
jgi:hypothetical protein